MQMCFDAAVFQALIHLQYWYHRRFDLAVTNLSQNNSTYH